MGVLFDFMKNERKVNFDRLVGMYRNQKQSETDWYQRRDEMLAETVENAKKRYEAEIREEERRTHELNTEIPKLEQLEKEMINRLRKTQNQHEGYVRDFERINKRERPEGPLSTLNLH